MIIGDRRSEFDSLFVFENLVVLAEDTCTQSTYEHLLKKNNFYEHLHQHKDELVSYLTDSYPEFQNARRAEFDASDYDVIFLYCSDLPVEESYKERFPKIHFLHGRHVRYFRALAATLGKSARFELFKFFGLKARDVGLSAGATSKTYDGFVLPESPSGFPRGYKLATFYADPATLISLSYVLRKDGWRDRAGLYQRMISRGKIRSMRRYLAHGERVFINNIIASLPAGTRILDSDGKTVDPGAIRKTTPVRVEVPIDFNSIGIIDGQHRIFAYHEGYDTHDAKIAPLRVKQQLLITGVVYPQAMNEDKQREFEARLFLEINDKQTRTRAELRQAIETIVNPFSVIAIARAVVDRLATSGPLRGYLEEDAFDVGKLKTSSIVSYGMKHIVKVEGTDTFFSTWGAARKSELAEAVTTASKEEKVLDPAPRDLLADYVLFCATEINNLIIAFKKTLPPELWTLERKMSRALTATSINGLIFCLRRLLAEGKTRDLQGYERGFKELTIQFTPARFKYRSSHWNELGDAIAEQCFL